MKLVVSDMDGTLINHQSGISPANLKAIQQLQENGIEFAIASGRDFYGVRSILDQYDIRCHAILGNGAQYCDEDGQVIMSCYLNKSVFADIIQIFENAHVPYMVFTTKGFYTRYQPSYVQEQFIERGIKRFGNRKEDYDKNGSFVNCPCNLLEQFSDIQEFLQRDLDIIKVEAFSLNATDIAPTKELLAHIPTISYLSSFEDNVEVTNENAQKGLILQQVAQLKKIDKKDIAVLGDGMNDFTLFQLFPYSFAPKNADDTIKSLAYRVVDECENDGFAKAIDIILKEKI